MNSKDNVYDLFSEVLDQVAEKIANNVVKSIKEESNQEEANQFLNKKEVCSFLNISSNTLGVYIKAGLPFIQLDEKTSIRYKRSDVIKFMEQNTKTEGGK